MLNSLLARSLVVVSRKVVGLASSPSYSGEKPQSVSVFYITVIMVVQIWGVFSSGHTFLKFEYYIDVAYSVPSEFNLIKILIILLI